MKFLFIIALVPLLSWAQDLEHDLQNCVQKLDEITEIKTCDDGLEERAASFKLDLVVDGFPRVESGISNACTANQGRDGYQEQSVFECSGGPKKPGGFSFRSTSSHPQLGSMNSPYGGTSRPLRQLDIISKNDASNETFLYTTVSAGGPDSHDMKSIILLLPRTTPPRVEVTGNDIEITLPTGEKVIVDKQTSAIKSGALKEGIHDLNMDRFKRKPANITYTGDGISIQVDHRFEYPTQGAVTAEVKQGPRVCKLPKNKIWDANGKLLTKTDADLVSALNANCPKKPTENPFKI